MPPTSVDPAIKNCHWLDLVQGLLEAYDYGAETALIVDTSGNIAEGPGFNVFAVKDRPSKNNAGKQRPARHNPSNGVRPLR